MLGINKNDNGYCIAYNEENLIDEDIAIHLNIGLKLYQKILKKCGAEIYKHEFIYSDTDKKTVQDSYFNNYDECKNAVNYLNKL